MQNNENPYRKEEAGTGRTDHGARTANAAKRLRDLIVTGILKPRQHISERSLLEQYPGLSRTPLREALKILAAEGLVDLYPNRGAFVAQMTLRQVEEALEVLIGLDQMAATACCRRITDGEIHEIEQLHHRMLAAVDKKDLLGYFDINQLIHQKIVDGAHNSALSGIYRRESQRIRRYRYAGNIEASRWKEAVSEHNLILRALQARDGPLLRELLRAHHSRGWKVARLLQQAELSADAP